MKNKLIALFVAALLVVALVGCSIPGVTIQVGGAPLPTLMPTLVPPQPTYTPYPTQIPPTPYPTAVPPTAIPPTSVPQYSNNMGQILLNNGFADIGAGDCGNFACEDYTYRSGDVALNGVVSANGFGLSMPLTDGYDAGGEGTIAGTVLAQAVNGNVIPRSVAEWIIGNMANAQSSPSTYIDGYSIQINMTPNNSGVYFMNIVASR
jgi:hypothetical protein